MGKPTVRVKKTIKISLQMTENRARQFEEMVRIFLQAAELQPYPNEFLSAAKGDYLRLEVKDGKGRI